MKKVYLFTAVAAGSLLLAGTAFAQVRTGVAMPKQKRLMQCETVNKNVEKRIGTFATKEERHTEQYQKTYRHIEAVVAKLEADGYDVSAIQVQLVQMNSLIKKYRSDYDLYLSELRDTKSFTCDRSESEFKAKLGIARAQLKVVHDDSVAIRTYWAQTLKPAIVALKTPAASNTVEGGTR